jgi:hypothetical protein
MRPTTATNDNVFDFQALPQPGTVFEHPKDVVAHPSLTLAEKRAILASWASDAAAIASCPALRASEGLKAPVSIDALLKALRELDGGPRNPPAEHAEAPLLHGPSAGGLRRNAMEDMRLPRHVIDRLEHRWASRLQQDAKVWSSDRNRPFQTRHVQTDVVRAIPVIVKRARGANAKSSRA